MSLATWLVSIAVLLVLAWGVWEMLAGDRKS